jgi:hypothetical protein
MLSLIHVFINNNTVISLVYTNNKYMLEFMDDHNYFSESFKLCKDALYLMLDIINEYTIHGIRSGKDTFIRIYVDRDAFLKLCTE